MGLRPSFSVIIATYGDPSWRTLAERAAYSVKEQSVQPDSLILSHHDSLHQARNGPIERLTSEWLIFLDADDELDFRYIEVMSNRVVELGNEDYLIQPSTLGVQNGIEDDYPVLIPERDIQTGNWMVIGTAVKRESFLRAGGFPDLPCWEDWALWAQCIENGSQTTTAPEAVYRVTAHSNGRNNPTQADASTAVRFVKRIFQ